MRTEPELLNERLDRLAIVLDEIMPNCALLVRDALDLLKGQPELVRCKDCKHGEKVPTFKYYPDVTWCNEHFTSHNDDWFCADGERK